MGRLGSLQADDQVLGLFSAETQRRRERGKVHRASATADRRCVPDLLSADFTDYADFGDKNRRNVEGAEGVRRRKYAFDDG